MTTYNTSASTFTTSRNVERSENGFVDKVKVVYGNSVVFIMLWWWWWFFADFKTFLVVSLVCFMASDFACNDLIVECLYSATIGLWLSLKLGLVLLCLYL